MRIRVEYKRMLIIPENVMDQVYLENVFGAEVVGGLVEVECRNAMGILWKDTFLEIKPKKLYDENK